MKFYTALTLAGLLASTCAFAQDDDPIQVSPEKTNAAAAAAQQKGGAGGSAGPNTEPPAQGSGGPATGSQKFYFEVDQSDLAAISQALSELPKRVADPLILKLNGQLAAQAQIVGNKDAAEKAKKPKK